MPGRSQSQVAGLFAGGASRSCTSYLWTVPTRSTGRIPASGADPTNGGSGCPEYLVSGHHDLDSWPHVIDRGGVPLYRFW